MEPKAKHAGQFGGKIGKQKEISEQQVDINKTGFSYNLKTDQLWCKGISTVSLPHYLRENRLFFIFNKTKEEKLSCAN